MLSLSLRLHITKKKDESTTVAGCIVALLQVMSPKMAQQSLGYGGPPMNDSVRLRVIRWRSTPTLTEALGDLQHQMHQQKKLSVLNTWQRRIPSTVLGISDAPLTGSRAHGPSLTPGRGWSSLLGPWWVCGLGSVSSPPQKCGLGSASLGISPHSCEYFKHSAEGASVGYPKPVEH